MSQAEHEPTNRPAKDAKFDALEYHIAVNFHPELKLIKAKGFEFAGSLSSIIDPSGVQLEEKQWAFSQPHGSRVGGQFQVVVGVSTLAIGVVYPEHNEEWFEYRYHLILKEFYKSYKPQLVMNSTAIIRGTLQVDGDAREFLMTHVTRLDQERLKKLGRPVHLFGIRLFMPPYQRLSDSPKKKKKGVAEAQPEVVGWMVDVKAESLIEDPKKLFLEAKCDWVVPQPWSDRAIKDIESHLAEAANYLKYRLVPFLESEASDTGE
ncbi:MAG TPA: hypothetical protein VGY55_01700 [Pirellulales bacterium]|jgi:hypothetical protein|nr:hypothetical protein [Pirellulales bacterium]